jgi:TetR/AcrR family transcriptional repressor of lmrAB and yxaGH operons
MVRKAAELFQKQGYNGTGLKQIIEESDTPKGSLYFHFPGGKEDLAIEALRQACESQRAGMQKVFDRTGSALDAIEDLIRSTRDCLVGSGFECGSPIATVVLEMAVVSDKLQQTCSGAWLRWEELFEERLAAEGHERERAKRLAMVSIALLEGGLLLCRAHRSTEPLDMVEEEIRNILEIRQP